MTKPAILLARTPSPRASDRALGRLANRWKRVGVGVLLAGSTLVALAAPPDDTDDAAPSGAVWQESAIELPAPPAKENLLEFFVSATATQTFAIDAKSASVGADGVVRYTLISRSNAGAESISYEGIRCVSFEHKPYAFGHADGHWSRSRRDQWQPIDGRMANRPHAALARDYFCSGRMVAGSAQEIVARMRAQRPLTQSMRP